MILEWAHFGQKNYDELTRAANYSAGFVHVPDTPGIGIEVHDDVVKERLEPGYPAL
jgi:L-alanine-DL-glutamate epimerase-like enolase superfamily enzyme